MIKIIVINTETGIDLVRDYDESFFSDNQAERLGKELHDMVDMVKNNNEQFDIPGFENTREDLDNLRIIKS